MGFDAGLMTIARVGLAVCRLSMWEVMSSADIEPA